MDFNNPVSIKYSERAMDSFQFVSDLIRIEPVQCTLPEDIIFEDSDRKDEWGYGPYLDNRVCGFDVTMPTKGNWLKEGDWNRVGSMQEKAALISHLKLIRMASLSYERFFVLEHDAWLKSPDTFRKLYDLYYHQTDYFNVGIAVECYSLSKGFANYMTNEHNTTMMEGPMGFLHRHYNTWHQREYGYKSGEYRNKNDIDTHDGVKFNSFTRKDKLVYVVAGQTNKTAVGTGLGIHRDSMANIFQLKNKKRLFDAPVTQVVARNLGVTIEHTNPGKNLTEAKNLHVVDEFKNHNAWYQD